MKGSVGKKKRLSERNSLSHLTDNQLNVINKIIGGAKVTEKIIDQIKRDNKSKKKQLMGSTHQQKGTTMVS